MAIFFQPYMETITFPYIRNNRWPKAKAGNAFAIRAANVCWTMSLLA